MYSSTPITNTLHLNFNLKLVKLLFGHLLVPHTRYWPVVRTCLLAIVGTKGVVTMDRRAPGGYTADGAPNMHGIHNLTTSLQLQYGSVNQH